MGSHAIFELKVWYANLWVDNLIELHGVQPLARKALTLGFKGLTPLMVGSQSLVTNIYIYIYITLRHFKNMRINIIGNSNITNKLEEKCILCNEAHLQPMPKFQYGNKQKPKSQLQCLNQGANLPQIKHDKFPPNITPDFVLCNYLKNILCIYFITFPWTNYFLYMM